MTLTPGVIQLYLHRNKSHFKIFSILITFHKITVYAVFFIKNFFVFVIFCNIYTIICFFIL